MSEDKKIHGSVTSEYQTNNNLIGNGMQLQYGTPHFLLALSGSYRLAKNYRNAVDGRVYNTGFSEKNISALMGYKSSKGYTHVNFTLYDNLQGIPDGSRDSLTRKFTSQVFEGMRGRCACPSLCCCQPIKQLYIIAPAPAHPALPRLYKEQLMTLAKATLVFCLQLQQNIRREYNHPAVPQQAGMYVRLNTLNYDVRYNAPRWMNIETAVGINGMLQSNRSKNATDFPIPDYRLADGGCMYMQSGSKTRYRLVAVFATICAG